MKIKILNKRAPGSAIGKNEQGDDCIVIGGDLYDIGQTITAHPVEGKENLFIIPEIDYENINLFSHNFDRYGLIDFYKIKEVKLLSKPFNRIYELDGYWVFPERRIKSEVEYLYTNDLINISKIKIAEYNRSSVFRAPVYNPIDFISLLERVIRDRKAISSWYYCDQKSNYDEGIYADLYIIADWSGDNLQIQLYQIIGMGHEALFAHGLIDKKSFDFIHFDFASHYVDPAEIPKLLYDKQRMEGVKKVKWMSIDKDTIGDGIDKRHFFAVLEMFFPMDYLVTEFKEKSIKNETR